MTGLSHQRIWQQRAYLATLLTLLSTSKAHGNAPIGFENELNPGSQQCAKKKSPFLKVPDMSFVNSRTNQNRRRVEGTSEETGEGCDICAGLHGTGILPDAPIPTFPTGALTSDPPNEGTCSDWNNSLAENDPPGSYRCKYFTYFLASQCCDRSNMTASYICESQLKSELLGDDSGYENTAVPVPAGEDKLNVTVALTFYHVTSLDTVDGTAEIFFGIDLTWVDERLAWDPAEHDGCLDITVRASLDAETTEIYVPDFNLLNRVEGVQSLPAEMALVAPDGTVRWRRNGGLKGLCAFTGLEPIPFDTLGCYYSFGSLTGHNVLYNFGRGDPHTPGLTFSHFPSKYQEFSLIPDRSETYATEVEIFRVLRYQFYFDRANRYYIIKIVIPTILFTYLSFGTFLLDQRVGERLSYGVSILLVMVAQSIVTSDMLPISDERLWIDTFSVSSYYWAILAVLESIIVAYLYYLDSEEEKEEERRAEEEEEEEEEERLRRLDEHDGDGLQKSNSIHDHIDAEEYSHVEVSIDSNGNKNLGECFNSGHSSTTKDEHNSAKVGSSIQGERKSKQLSPQRPKLERLGAANFTAILTRKKKTTTRRKQQIIRNLDQFCLIVLPLTYTIFVIAMFSTASIWG